MKKQLLGLGLAGVLAASPAVADEAIDFVIDDGRVVPSESFAVLISVLGAEISSGFTPLPVTARADIGQSTIDPFGAFNDFTSSNLNVAQPVQHFVYQEQLDPGTPIVVTGRSWFPNGSVIHTANSSDDVGGQVEVLRDGDPVPRVRAFSNQSSVGDLVGPYVVNDRISLDENQVIYLFELGSTNRNSSAFDLQDLVILVTLGESVDALQSRFEPLYD